jgi:Domain of unknown function (DUF4398)
MTRINFIFGVTTVVAVATAGCASYPVPVQRMADAEGATRSAQDLGAASSPQGQLHLKLAEEETAQAKQLIANGDNQRADYVLMRAKADAELAVAEAKDTTAEQQAGTAQAKTSEMRSGIQPTTASVTTTSSTTAGAYPSSPPGSTTSTSTSTTVTGGPK